jgi:hypothetical protein
MMSRKINIVFVLLLSLFFMQCEDEGFKYDKKLLTEPTWGLPEIKDSGPAGSDFIQTSPTNFREDGRVTIGGRTYYWRVMNSRSILIERRNQQWFIIDLTEDRLEVEINKHPAGEYMVHAVFRPVE